MWDSPIAIKKTSSLLQREIRNCVLRNSENVFVNGKTAQPWTRRCRFCFHQIGCRTWRTLHQSRAFQRCPTHTRRICANQWPHQRRNVGASWICRERRFAKKTPALYWGVVFRPCALRYVWKKQHRKRTPVFASKQLDAPQLDCGWEF